MGRLVILSGPSCVGKGPLHAALKKFHPDLAASLQPIVLYNSRVPRPKEQDGVDYHFRPREDIEALRDDDHFVVMDVRGDLQALDLRDVERLTREGDAFFEGNPFVGCQLLECPLPEGVARVSAFLSPLSRDEVEHLSQPSLHVDLPAFVTDVMRRKLLRRTTWQKHMLSKPDLEEIERRCTSTWRELQDAWRFDWVIPNHDGEDSENWTAFYHPLADARKALLAFAALLRGEDPPPWVERWDEDLVP
ncbi:MAG: guanylate kinase [Planctomycetota bacterium]